MGSKAVIGLGFGDEGKGLTTNFLCLQNPEALVIRYSGGQQAGHTVVLDGKRHVFSNFGSGALNCNRTYWSKYCTVDPFGLYNEMQILSELGVTPTIYIDGKCPVTTPFDKFLNQNGEDLRNGTCGAGVGPTFERESRFYSLLFEDLFFPEVVKFKIELMLKNYYPAKAFNQEYLDVFNHCVKTLTKHPQVCLTYGIPKLEIQGYKLPFESLIFEGSQGLLLDQHYGFFPHVTRSNTGSTNIVELGHIPEFWCVTRAYQTRHGNGHMTNTDIPHKFELNPLETNVLNKYQGEFKISVLDVSLLEYAIMKDSIISTHRDNLVITCLDQVQKSLQFTYKGELFTFEDEMSFVLAINKILKFKNIYLSHSDKSEELLPIYKWHK